MENGFSRRSFLAGLAGGAALSGLTPAQAARAHRGIAHADSSLSAVPMHEMKGEWYDAAEPDTLDLAERAAFAIKGITCIPAPADDYTIFFLGDFVDWAPGQAFLRHHWPSDLVGGQPKLLEALPLLRLISGSKFNDHVDAKMMETYLHITEADGLSYLRADNRPWRKDQPGLPRGVPFASAYCEGRLLLALNMWHQAEGSSRWSEMARKKVDSLLALMRSEGDSLYLPQTAVYPGDLYVPLNSQQAHATRTIENAIMLCGIAHGAAQYYDLTGYRPALKLARGVSHYYRQYGQIYGADGRFLISHFHMQTYGLIGALEAALAAQDEEQITFAQQGYEFAKAMGEPQVGFFPEHIITKPGRADAKYYRVRAGGRGNTCESCCIADMLVLATKLSRAGVADYWEDVERYTRNQYVENQMLRADWVSRVPEVMANDKSGQAHRIVFPFPHLPGSKGPLLPAQREWLQKAGFVDDTDAGERLVGTWAGWSRANDFLDPVNGPGIMHCCTGNAARTLYYIWDSIIVPEPNKVRVNLLLSRVSPWLDVHSHLPYEGRIDLKIKRSTTVALRIPSWARRQDVRCFVNNGERGFKWAGQYIEIDDLPAGAVASVMLPQYETKLWRVIGQNIYHLTVRGFTVTEIDPQGELYPLYQRADYAQRVAPVKKKRRFVSSKMIRW